MFVSLPFDIIRASKFTLHLLEDAGPPEKKKLEFVPGSLIVAELRGKLAR